MVTTVAHEPAPTRQRRWPWLLGGLCLEGAALVVIAGTLYHESKPENGFAGVTKYSLRLAWQDVLHRRSLVLLMVVCALAYMAGATLVAGPFVHSRLQLFLMVPVAALASLVVLGVLALAVTILFYSDGGLDLPWPDGGIRSRSRREHNAVDDLDMT